MSTPPSPELSGHNALSALIEYYTDVIRTYEAHLIQLNQVNGAMRVEIEKLRKKDSE
jgi:hypothetical protein